MSKVSLDSKYFKVVRGQVLLVHQRMCHPLATAGSRVDIILHLVRSIGLVTLGYPEIKLYITVLLAYNARQLFMFRISNTTQ